MEKLRALVVMNESIKQQEQQFKSHCQEERARLQQAIADLKEGGAREEDERVVELQAKFDADREKLQKIRTLLVSVCVCVCVSIDSILSMPIH